MALRAGWGVTKKVTVHPACGKGSAFDGMRCASKGLKAGAEADLHMVGLGPT